MRLYARNALDARLLPRKSCVSLGTLCTSSRTSASTRSAARPSAALAYTIALAKRSASVAAVARHTATRTRSS